MEIVDIKNPKAINKAIEYLNNGEIVIYPTETCYGVGVDATNSNAVTKVLKYKKRPEGKAISVAVANKDMAETIVEINDTAKNIYSNFLPGPVTIISKSKNLVDKRLESEKGTLGIRIPDYDFILKLLNKFKKPVTSTSANSAGKKTPYNIEDILQNISEKQRKMIGLIIDASQLPHNPPSTVIDTTTDELTAYRHGNIMLGNKAHVNSNDREGLNKIAEFTTSSAEQTIQAGSEILSEIINLNKSSNPIIILLDGELGAGKTQVTKGFGKFLEIDRIIKSPTYIYLNEYNYSVKYHEGKLIHIDAWRIKSKQDLETLNLKSYLKKDNIVSIEWPSVMSALDFKFEKTKIYIVKLKVLSENSRKISVYEKSK